MHSHSFVAPSIYLFQILQILSLSPGLNRCTSGELANTSFVQGADSKVSLLIQ